MALENYESISYITHEGDEIILSTAGDTNCWETIGRSGFLAPEVKTKEVTFANGAFQTLSVTLQPRKVTLQMVITGTDRTEALRLYHDLVNRLIQIGSRQYWGKLKIVRPSGPYYSGTYYLNCVYKGGLNIQETLPYTFQFSLEFLADDPLFYDAGETAVTMRIWEENFPYLHFQFGFGSNTHFRSPGNMKTQTVVVSGYRVYPTITVTGPARGIRIENQTIDRAIAFDPSFILLAGESAVIETAIEKRSAVVHRLDGSEENGLKWLTPESSLEFYLTAGSNVMNWQNGDLNPVSLCRLTYRTGRISV